MNKVKIKKIFCLLISLCFISISFLFSQESKSSKDLNPEFRKWLEEEVVYIITPKEKEIFLQLQTDRERLIFVEAFWKQRDPTPNIPGNEFKEEHYNRIKYVENWFGRDVPGKGWRTDMGRIYITLGPPKSIERYENSGEIYPVVIWFYDGMAEFRLPNSFNIVFFKKDGTGVYQLYSPVRYGPQSLLIHYYGDSTEYLNAFYKIMDIEPAVARVSLTLLSGENEDILQLSLASEVLISQKVPAAPYEKVKDSYAEKLLKYKDIVEVDYSANYIDNDSLIRVLQDKSGNFFVHYLIEPSRLTFEEYQGSFHANLEINGQVTDQSGKSIYQFDRTVPINFDRDQMSSIQYKLFSYQDMFPLVAGQYKFFSLIKNTISKEFTSAEANLIIPDIPALQLSQLILANRINKDTKYKGNNKPFLMGNTQLIPSPKNDFVRGDSLYVHFQIQGLAADRKEKVTIEYSIFKENEKVHSLSVNGKDLLDFPDVLEEFPLADFQPAYYTIKVSLLDANRTELFSQEAPFLITHLESLSRPWVVSMPMVSTQDPAFVNILGKQFLNKDDRTKAKPLLEEAYHKNPNSPEFALDLCNILFETKELQRVKQIAGPFLQDQRKYPFLQVVGQTCQALGEIPEAISYYKENLAYYGTNIFILNSVGDCYYQVNNMEEALNAFERSLELSPDQERIKALVKTIREK
ncbi:MAG: GWxTD domain-containing protein [Acidobacteria bacterium]|nr:GWxTD domain-containing protein [Acidobacteriota bacterium]MBU4494991.1 GWxTD domain-containing protein [Acidobacteriota bacterium]